MWIRCSPSYGYSLFPFSLWSEGKIIRGQEAAGCFAFLPCPLCLILFCVLILWPLLLLCPALPLCLEQSTVHSIMRHFLSSCCHCRRIRHDRYSLLWLHTVSYNNDRSVSSKIADLSHVVITTMLLIRWLSLCLMSHDKWPLWLSFSLTSMEA